MINLPLIVSQHISVNSAISLMSLSGHSIVFVVENYLTEVKRLQSKNISIEDYRQSHKFPASALLGIFTRGDVVRLAATGGLENLNLTISDVMTTPVITLDLAEIIPDGAEFTEINHFQQFNREIKKKIIQRGIDLLKQHQISQLPLVDLDENIFDILNLDHLIDYLNSNQEEESQDIVTSEPIKRNINFTDIELDIRNILVEEPLIILVINRQGIITKSEGKKLIKGWSAQELVARNFLELNLEQPEAIAQLRHILETGENLESINQLSVLFISESDEGQFFQWKYLPLTNIQGEFVGVTCVANNLTKSHKTEAELRSLFRAMTDLVFVLDAEGRYLNIAATNNTLLSKSPSEFLGKIVSDVLPPEPAALILSRIQLAIATQETVTVEYSLQIQDKEVWFDARISPFLEESVILVARDISERVKIEQELKQSQQFLQQIINATPDPIFVKNENHEFAIVNDALCDLIGYKREQVIGKNDSDFFPEEQVEIFLSIDRQVLETGSPYKLEERLTDSLGDIHVLSTKKTRIEDPNKNKFLVGIIREITDLVNIAEALKLSEERYRAFIAQSSEGICCWEFESPIAQNLPETEKIEQILHNGYIAECNEVMAQMYGMTSASESIGTPVTQWRDPNNLENREQLREFINSGYRLNKIEVTVSEIAESKQYFLQNLVGIIEDGCLQRIWMTQLDISERRAAEINLEKSEARYRGIIESQQDLIVRIDPAGCLTFVNDAYCRKFGKSASKLLGKNYLEVVHEDDRSTTFQIMELLKAPPYRVSLENRAISAEGYRWIAWENYAIRNQEGTIVEIQAVGRDISDRKQAELDLRKTEHFLELFFSQSLEGFFFMMLDSPVPWNNTVDKEKVLDYVFVHQRVTKVNDAMLAQYETTREEFIGFTLHDFFAHDLAYGRELVREFLNEGKLEMTSDERALNGRQIWIEGEYTCIYDDQGLITGLFGVQRDVSDRYRTQAALRESEERFRQIAENSQEIFWISSDDRQEMLYVNPAYESIFGQTAESLQADPLAWLDRTIHPDDRNRVINTVMMQILDPQEINYEYRIVRSDGSVRWLWERIFTILNSEGEIYRQAGLVADITQRKEMEETVRVTQERLGYLITMNPAVIYSLNPWGNSRTTFISDNVKTLLGYDPEEFLENPSFWIEHIHPEDLSGMSIPIESGLQTGYRMSDEYRFRSRSGSYRWMRDENRLLFDDEGNPFEVVGYLADITERKQAEEEIRKSINKERELNALKTRFITMTSHEFRTPLATILSSADLLEVYLENGDRKKSDRHIERIQSAGEHLTNMLNDILEISQSQGGQQDFQPGTINLAAFCREIISHIKSRSSNKPISFICSSESEAKLSEAFVDSTLVRQILVNLLSNAVKYSGRDSEVTLELSASPNISEEISQTSSNMATFKIKDTGFGIDPEDTSRIFDAFYRGNNIKNIPGTGLGLAIVKHAVDLHGGEITFDSILGKGTTFTVILPLFIDG